MTAWLTCVLWIVVVTAVTIPVPAQGGTDFTGTVLSVDPGPGKFTVKKTDSGTRFTFVANDKTVFEGGNLKGLKDLKKGDQVTVTYQVAGSQYVALKVTAKEK